MAATRFRPPRPVHPTLNLAPMVDVMMCLIIFFLLASQLVAARHGEVRLPFSQTARESERGVLGPKAVINVRPGSAPGAEAALGVEYVVEDWDGQRVTERILSVDEIVAFLRARAAATAGGGLPLRCVIRADRSVRYEHVEAVLRACGRQGLARIVFATHVGAASDPEP